MKGGEGRDPLFAIDRAGTFYLPELQALSLRDQVRFREALDVAAERWSATRVVVGTTHDPAEEVARGRLDPGLATLFKTGTVRVPALRERPEDLAAIIGQRQLSRRPHLA